MQVMTANNVCIGILLIGKSGSVQEGSNITSYGILIGESTGKNSFGAEVSNMYFVMMCSFE